MKRIVLDAHCDAPSQMLRLRDYSIDNEFAQVDFPKMRRGGVDASFFAAYVPASLQGAEATDYAKRLLDVLDSQIQANADSVAYARCAGGVRRNKSAGLTSILIGIENASALNGDLALLKAFYKRGVRYITLTHSSDNAVGDSCTGQGTWGGLSPFGKELVVAMNRQGMLIDVAHSAESTMRDVLALSQRPIAYTHGCCSALCPHKRNISDELIRGIADGGGVVCMSIYPHFLSASFPAEFEAAGFADRMRVEDEFISDPADESRRKAWEDLQREINAMPRPGISLVADHIEHAVSVAGIDHVGIGTDYDGIESTASGLEDIGSFHKLWDVLSARGFSERDIKKIAGENLLRVLNKNVIRKNIFVKVFDF